MNCPKCDAPVRILSALSKCRAEFICNTCGASLRLTGHWWLILLPQVLGLIFPYYLISNSTAAIFALMALFAVSTVFVCKNLLHVEVVEGPPAVAQDSGTGNFPPSH